MFALLDAAPALLSNPLLGDKATSFWFPDSASTFASEIDWLYGYINWICVLFFIPIVFALFYFTYKYHKPKGTKAEPSPSHNTPLELAWSILPSFFLVSMFVMGAKSFLDHRSVPDGANEIGVQASTWSWLMDYGGGTLNPELHILVNEPTKLSMRSKDVIHSVYIPAFRVKKDVVPGRYNFMWFQATKVSEKVDPEVLAKAQKETKDLGEAWDYDKYQFTPEGYKFYDLYCAEYCGKDHSQMQTQVVVHETLEDLNAWIKLKSKRGPDETLLQYGEKLYNERGCKGCHSLDGSKRVGPSFKETFGNDRPLIKGGAVAADENYILESIRYPKEKVVAGFQPVMPSYKGQLTDDDIHSIIEYLKSVSDHTPTETAEPKATNAEADKTTSTE